MHRIDHVTKSADLHGVGKDGFTEGDPVGGVAPTVVTDDWLNDLQENVCEVIEAQGISLVKGVATQLHTAIRRHIQRAWDGAALRTWLGFNPAGGTANLYSVVYGESESKWVACGEAGTILLGEADGDRWQVRASDGPFVQAFNCVTYASGFFIIGGDAGEIQSSPTGATWTSQSAGGGYASPFRGAAGKGSLVVLVGDAGEIQICDVSGGPTTWASVSPAGAYAGNFLAVTSTGTTFVAVGSGGEIQTSTDGLTWTARSSGTTADLHAVAYNATRGELLACGRDGAVCISSDGGVTWALTTVGAFGSIGFGAALPLGYAWAIFGRALSGDDGGGFYVSEDAVNWYRGQAPLAAVYGAASLDAPSDLRTSRVPFGIVVGLDGLAARSLSVPL